MLCRNATVTAFLPQYKNSITTSTLLREKEYSESYNDKHCKQIGITSECGMTWRHIH